MLFPMKATVCASYIVVADCNKGICGVLNWNKDDKITSTYQKLGALGRGQVGQKLLALEPASLQNCLHNHNIACIVEMLPALLQGCMQSNNAYH